MAWFEHIKLFCGGKRLFVVVMVEYLLQPMCLDVLEKGIGLINVYGFIFVSGFFGFFIFRVTFYRKKKGLTIVMIRLNQSIIFDCNYMD